MGFYNLLSRKLFSSYKLSNIRFYSSEVSETQKFDKSRFYEHQFFIITDVYSEKKVDALAEIFNNLASVDRSEDTHKVNLKVFVAHKSGKNQTGASPEDRSALDSCITAIKATTKHLYKHTHIPLVNKAWSDMEKLANSLIDEYDSCLVGTENPILDREGVANMINKARAKIKKDGIVIDFRGSPFEISSGQRLPPKFNPSNQDLNKRIRVINLTSYSEAELLTRFTPKENEKAVKPESPTSPKETKLKKKD